MKKYLLFVLILCTTRLLSQNIYLLNNRFESDKFTILFKQNENTSPIKKSIAKSLKGYIKKFSDDRDTAFIKFWDIVKNKDSYSGNKDTINSDDNGALFAFCIDWKKEGNYISIPFTATVVTATSIPFRYRITKNTDLDASFLNAGISLFYLSGKSRYYKQEQIDPRQYYHGLGMFIGFSQQKIDSSNTDGKVLTEKQVGVISYGINYIKSWNGLSVILALGCDNTIGKNAKYWNQNNFRSGFKPWLGFGFGFKLADITIKAVNSQ